MSVTLFLSDINYNLHRFYNYCGFNDDEVSSNQYIINIDKELKKYHAMRFDWYTSYRCIIFDDEKHYNWFLLKWIDE